MAEIYGSVSWLPSFTMEEIQERTEIFVDHGVIGFGTGAQLDPVGKGKNTTYREEVEPGTSIGILDQLCFPPCASKCLPFHTSAAQQHT